VTAIALLCLVLLCTPVRLDCSLVALQAGLLFTPVDACSVRLLFIVLRFCRPTLRIHYWSLQHTPVRTYCSPLSCMRSKSQLRLPCQLISIILLTISSYFLILLMDEQLRLPCHLLVLYCSPLAVLSLYCSPMSNCDSCRLLVLLLRISSSCIMLLIIEQLRPPCQLNSIILLIIEQLRLPCRLI
jgi:hypothetical protein